MAKFKIELLTPVSRSGIVYYISSVLSDFASQTATHKNSSWAHHLSHDNLYNANANNAVYSFTDKEQFAVKANAQKTLSFTMYRKILQGEYWEDNPYVNNIHIGSQLLLTDKYGDEHLFTVTNIKFKISETNIEYSYSCEDTFNYQTIRQNDGYTIKNNPEEDDFIGAKTADWWIINKIQPECYITYEFLPFGMGLYRSKNGEFFTYTANDTLTTVEEIIKPIYTDDIFFETIPFSCSGSNGVAALIALAEQIGCQINIFEHRFEDESGYIFFRRHFWLEPTKNSQPTGLTYSPFKDIQSFDLSYNGRSLTTVLNVLTHTLNDEEVSIFPALPGVFLNYFNSIDWQQTKYYPGMFTDIINGQFYSNIGDTANLELDSSVTDIWYNNTIYSTVQLQDIGFNTIFWPIYYDSFLLKWDDMHATVYRTVAMKEGELLTLSSSTPLLLVSRTPLKSHSALDLLSIEGRTNYDYLRTDVKVLKEGDPLPEEWLGHRLYCYAAFALGSIDQQIETDNSINWIDLYFKFTRDFTEDEYAFAQAADACPWLENKLIDFSYFVKQKILSQNEYDSLMSLILNDMRILNGQLMAASKSYYQALHQQTKILAELTAKIDMLGAEFAASVIKPYTETGAVGSLENFATTYQSFFQTQNHARKTSLLNYDEVLSDLFEKYFNTEQRFLKNIYNFRQYFNTVNSFSSRPNACIATDTLIIDHESIDLNQPNQSLSYFTFSPAEYRSIYRDGHVSEAVYQEGMDKPLTPIFEYQQTYTPLQLVTKANLQTLYTNAFAANELVEITEETPQLFIYNKNSKYFLLKADFAHLFPEEDLSTRIVKFKESSGYVEYVELSQNELSTYYLHKNPNKYYIRDTQRLIPFDWVRYSWTQEDVDKAEWKSLLFDRTLEGQYYYYWIQTAAVDTMLQDAAIANQHPSWISRAVFAGCNYRKLLTFFGTYFDIENKNPWDSEFGTPDQLDEVFLIDGWAFYKHQFATNELSYYGHVFQVQEQDSDLPKVNIINEKHKTVNEFAIKEEGTNPLDYRMFQALEFYSKPLETPIFSEGYRKLCEEDRRSFSYFAYTSWDDIEEVNDINTALLAISNFSNLMPIPSITVTTTGYARKALSRAAALELGRWTKNYHPRKTINTDNFIEVNNYLNLGSPILPVVDSYDRAFLYDSPYGLFFKTQEGPLTASIYQNALQKSDFSEDTKQFFDYFDLIVPTYSFEYKRPFEFKDDKWEIIPAYMSDKPNPQYKLWIKNKYWRVLPAGATINKKDSYYILPLWSRRLSEDEIANFGNLWTDVVSKEKDRWFIGYETFDDMPVIPLSNPLEFAPFYQGLMDNSSVTDVIKDVRSMHWANKKYSQLQYYFWKPFLTPLDITNHAEFWDENGCGVLNYNYLKDASGNSTPVFLHCVNLDSPEFQNRKVGFLGVVLHEENYEEAVINNDILDDSLFVYLNYWDNYSADQQLGYYIKPTSDVAARDVYERYTDRKVSLIDQPDLCAPSSDIRLFAIPSTDDYFTALTDKIPEEELSEWWEKYNRREEDDLRFYEKQGDDYIPRYTMRNIVEDAEQEKPRVYPFYCLSGDEWTTNSFVDDVMTFTTTVYLHQVKTENGKIVYHNVQKYPGLYTFDFSTNNNSTYLSDVIIPYQNNEYHANVRLKRDPKPTYLQRMSNGEFWYRYHTRTDLSLIFEHCALIETELTMFWQQALTASKYCKYFLPDAWQPTTETALNQFDSSIINVTYYKDLQGNPTTVQSVTLLDTILPVVKLYKNAKLNQVNPAWLPKYHFTLNLQSDYEYLFNSLQQSMTQPAQELGTTIWKENPAIRSVLSYLLPQYSLEMGLSSIVAEEHGYCNYYYVDFGGLLWKDVLAFCTGVVVEYDRYDGIYGLQFKTLYSNYESRPVAQYNTLLEAKNLLWQRIYREYPNVLLETNFSYNKATTSDELLRMAKLAMRDKTNPEEQYSMSILDFYNIHGYKGQKIKIGDSIALAANDFYDENDDLYHSLTKYLFITDISYSLRSDSDIKVTVNTVKYQDKLLQQLVKLIR